MIMSQLLWPSGTPFRLKPAEIRENIAAASAFASAEERPEAG